MTGTNATDEDQDLRKKFDFNKHRYANDMPISQQREKILDLVGGNQIVVISGATGCGKSTQVPQYILDNHAIGKKPVNIIVTQPRKLAASSIARRVCEERNWNLGGLVGYQVGLDKVYKGPDTRLLYVTTGVLKKMILERTQQIYPPLLLLLTKRNVKKEKSKEQLAEF